MSDDELVTVGRVVRPHGIRGEFVVEAAGEVLGQLDVGAEIFLEGGGVRAVSRLRPHAGRWLVGLEGIEDRDAAERLRDRRLLVPAERLPDPAEDEFYIDDLLGAVVETPGGENLGRVVAVHAGAGQDLMELRHEDDIRLIPMVRDWLVEADAEAGRIVMDLPPGFQEAEGPVRPGAERG
ncbi:MAG: ribosome maturation factor RimM [Acidobacteriota bacterium]